MALSGVQWLFELAHLDTRFIEGLPTALAKPFSGSAARALMIETMQHHGVDSFPALVAATVQGSTETTFYVLAVRSEEHTSELQSRGHLVCRLMLEENN